jgi:outer membrane autotransporter protein
LSQVKVDTIKPDRIQFGYWMQLQKQQNNGVAQGIQNLNGNVLSNNTSLDTQAWMNQWGIDAAFQQANYNYHMGISLGATQGNVLAKNEETQVESITKGRTVGLYAVTTGLGQTWAISIQKGWFDHEIDEDNYNSQTLISKFKGNYPLSFVKSAVLPITLSTTVDLIHKQYEDSLGSKSTHSSTYEGSLGLQLSAKLGQFTPFVTLDYNFGTSQDLAFKTTNTKGNPITFTMLAKPIPVDFGIRSGFGYTLGNQLSLQSNLNYHKISNPDESEALNTKLDLAHQITYHLKDNIAIEAKVNHAYLEDDDHLSGGIYFNWTW